ncbi:MAG: hypothetical protein IJD49_02725 [Clostridia bacterium]|nr:hypothetical protein [Clostridia bacterium]
MKCDFCGKRIKKSEDICPNCGKSVIRAAVPAEEVTAASDGTVTIRYSDYISRTVIANIAQIVACAALIAVFPLTDLLDEGFVETKTLFSCGLFVILAILTAFNTAFAVIQSKQCYITFSEDKISGVMPAKFAETEEFSISTEDVTAFAAISSLWRSVPEAIICCGDERFGIKCHNNKLLSAIKKELKIRFPDK